MPRSKKFGKRKFKGNQFSKAKTESLSDKINLSASGKKLKLDKTLDDDIGFKEDNSNVIIEVAILREMLNTVSKCKHCDSFGTFDVYEEVKSRKGLATNLIILCTKCKNASGSMTSSISSCKYDVNIRLVYGLRCIGRGEKSAQVLCGIMNLPPPPSKFERYNNIIINHLSTVSSNSMKQATTESVLMQNGNTDLVAAFDGTWQKRGHTSLNGVVCATSLENGKVIDFECLTKYCFYCKNKAECDHDCQKNFQGYSGGMEAEGVLKIFQRSIQMRNVRYIKYLGDGDSKGFMKVSEANVYGEDIAVKKLECIGHIQKRMGSRLRSLRADMKKEKLSDGKCLSGRGRLTDAEISKLQNYYGLAIRQNTSNTAADMVKSIWSIYFHRLSTDANPQHGLCPTGPDTWCKFNRAMENGDEFHHKNPLPEAVCTAIKPVFRSLTDKKLLEKCMHGRTQNPNESFNSCIWERLPKTKLIGITTLKIGVMDAVICFNDGVYSRIKVFESMGIDPGKNMRMALRKVDARRVCEAELKVQKLSKEARKQIRRQKKLSNKAEKLSKSEYAPGMF